VISAAEVTARTSDDGAMPLLTLDEFFDGNAEEGSIAPNQWGGGRPPLAVLPTACGRWSGRASASRG
jgi:hypothetical protein